MSEDCPLIITVGDDSFEVSPGFLETLDEIGFLIRTNSRAEVIQQAVVLLYLLGRERHEKQAQTYMHYPNGAMRMLHFWKDAASPALHDVNKKITPTKVELDPAFEHYQRAMPDYKAWREHHLAVGQVAKPNGSSAND